MLTSLLTSLFIAMLLPFIAKAPLAFAMHRTGKYDNRYPRMQQALLKGFGQRANAAHYNSFEALLIYACAVAITLFSGGADSTSSTLGWVFIASRVGYLLCYWKDLPTLRSVIWLIGTGAAFSMAARALYLS